jgi:3-methyladenine DNA glycosylase AlkD
MTGEEVLDELKSQGNRNPKDLAGMARYGINTENTLCLTMGKLDAIASKIKKESKDDRHKIALEIWKSGIREARIVAARIDVPELVTAEQMEKWVKDFNSWDVCDNTIMKLFSYTKLGWDKAIPWSLEKEEFVKRAGFVMMAMLAMHDKKAKDEDFYPFLKRIKEEATDERNFVRKAVNWALRTIGKARTKNLYNLALEKAKEIEIMDNKTAKWIAKDAIRELTTSKYILKRFGDE